MESDNPKTYRVKQSKKAYLTFCLSDITSWSELRSLWLSMKESEDFVALSTKFQNVANMFCNEAASSSVDPYKRAKFLVAQYLDDICKHVHLPSKHAFTAKLFHERSKKSTCEEQKRLLLSLAHFFVPSSERQLAEEIIAERMKFIEGGQKEEKTTLKPNKTVLSDKVSIKYTPEKGRHVIATKPIEPGEVVANEMPYASVLLSNQELHRCHHCLVDLDNNNNTNVWPCCECVNVLFCSRDCYHQAWQAYHRYECAHLPVFWFVGVGHLAYRIIAQTSPKVLPSYLVINPWRRYFPPDKFELNNYDEANFKNVWQLADNIKAQPLQRIKGFMLTAVLLQELLQRSKFEFDQQRLFGLLLVLLAQIVVNAHAISVMHIEKAILLHSVVDTKIATGSYPAISMLNHSCAPNTMATFSGRRYVLRAIAPIAAGDEVFNCYGVSFTTNNQPYRYDMLKEQYNFECHCSHCFNEARFVNMVEQAFHNTGDRARADMSSDDFEYLPLVHCKMAMSCKRIDNTNRLVCDQCGHRLNEQDICQTTKLIYSKLDSMNNMISHFETGMPLTLNQIVHEFRDLERQLTHIVDLWRIPIYGKMVGVLVHKYLEDSNVKMAFESMQKNLSWADTFFGRFSAHYLNEQLKWAHMVKEFGGPEELKELRGGKLGRRLQKLLTLLALGEECEPGQEDFYGQCLQDLQTF